jgi:hypothetical protein
MPTTYLNRPEPNKFLQLSIWTVQVLAFVAFVSTGLVKLVKPIPELAAMWPWTGQLPVPVVRTLAIVDIAGGLGVLLPSLTRIMPRLTVIAAWCCVTLQIFAMAFHISRGEAAVTPINVVFLALVAYVAWGRNRAPIQPR